MNENTQDQMQEWLAEGNARGDDFEKEILADKDLAEEAYASWALDETLAEVAQSEKRHRPMPRWFLPTTMVAAVLAMAIIFPRFQSHEQSLPPRLHSGGDIDGAVGISPAGEQDFFPRQFTWHPASGTRDARYRWELYDEQARRRRVVVVTDTVLTRAASETPADSLGTWRWFVVKLKPDGLEGPTSKVLEFTVKAQHTD